jgi:hypothetical protein
VTPQTGRLRVVIAWDATAQQCDPLFAGACQADVLDGDLDLWVSKWTGSGWQQVCTSSSWDSSWELCDIAVGINEQYKAEIFKASANSAGTFVGIAWNNYDPNVE